MSLPEVDGPGRDHDPQPGSPETSWAGCQRMHDRGNPLRCGPDFQADHHSAGDNLGADRSARVSTPGLINRADCQSAPNFGSDAGLVQLVFYVVRDHETAAAVRQAVEAVLAAQPPDPEAVGSSATE